MKMGFIGAGRLAQSFAARVIAGGHEVMLSNSRGPDSLQDVVESLGASAAAGTRYAVAELEIVVLAVRSPDVERALGGLAPWEGRTLVDATNHLGVPPPLPGVITTSEAVAGLVSGAHVLKSLNTVFASRLGEDPIKGSARRVIFVSGDDVPSKENFRALLESIGFASIDLGGLAEGGRLQQVPGGPLAGADLLRVL